MENNLTNLDFDKDDEVLYAADSAHEERDSDVQLGKKIAREKKYHAARVVTVSATPLDADLLPVPEIEQDNVEVRPELSRAVDSETAKQQMNAALAAAKATFKMPPEPKKPANDNYKPVVSWPLMDQLTRPTFEPDRERRNSFKSAALYLRGLIDLSTADPLGEEADCDIQRTESGEVFFEHGQSLDRRKWKNDDGEVRHVGSARTAKKSLPIGNRFNRNDPFPVRQLAAREDLNEIIIAVGPLLWPSLLAAVAKDATMTEIGLALGAKGTAAPPLGVRTIKRALTLAIEAIALRKDVSRETTPLPVKSRGSFWNQSKGAVVKVA